MLVLSRRQSQKIRIGDDIVITIVRIGPGAVRIGIDAPDAVLVLRDELDVEQVEQCEHATARQANRDNPND